MKRKILSVILSVILVVGMIPLTAVHTFAKEGNTIHITNQNEWSSFADAATYGNTFAGKTVMLDSNSGIDNVATSVEYCTVIFDMMGHGDAIDTQIVKSGEKVQKPTDPTVGGYTFGGWYTEEALINAWNFETDTVNANLTLYAKWEEDALVSELEDGYYLVGKLNGTDRWDAASLTTDMMLTPSVTPGVYKLDWTFCTDDKIKVAKIENNTITKWYKDGEDDYYTIGANEAGKNTLYFRSEGDMNWSYCYFTIVAENPAPVIDSDFIYLDTGGRFLWNQDAATFAVWTWGGKLVQSKAVTMTQAFGDIYKVDKRKIGTSVVFIRVAAGKTFDGTDWTNDTVLNMTAALDVPTNGNNTYTITGWGSSDGVWDVLSFVTVTFDMMGHGNAIDTQIIKSGEKVQKPTDPTADGYTFDGWYKDENLQNAWIFDTDIVTDNITLYAKWTKNPISPHIVCAVI